MASQAVTGTYLSHGLNENRFNVVEVILAQALANTETLDITLPTGIDFNSLPVWVVAYTSDTPAVRDADIGVITNHNKTTGVTRITASGDVDAGTTVLVGYVEPTDS